MTRKRATSDLPEYLHDSPFIPTLSDEEDRRLRTPQPKTPFVIPNPRQILRVAIRWRNQIAILLLVYTAWHIDWQSRIYGPSCLSYKAVTPVTLEGEDIHWHRFAYVQYVTSPEYLCNSLMFFEALERYGSKVDRVMLYPRKFKNVTESNENMMLLAAEKTYKVKTIPIDIQHKGGEYFRWADSLTKLLVFSQTRYKRILVVDSDSTLLKPMDELFFLPTQPAVMPRAYWLDQKKPILSSHIMLLEPSRAEFQRVKAAIDDAKFGEYDMEIMNKLYGRRKDCIVLPHRKYALLSGEFRRKTHRQYMEGEPWDAKAAFDEAKLIHFSDDPLDKPWKAKWDDVRRFMPDCEENGDCQARNIWLTLYSDYWKRAKDICWVNYGGLPSAF